MGVRGEGERMQYHDGRLPLLQTKAELCTCQEGTDGCDRYKEALAKGMVK